MATKRNLKIATRSQALHREAEQAYDERLKQAVIAWDRLSQKQKMTLARETIETRAQELRLAFPDIIAVGHGMRTTGKKSGRMITQESCIAFMVAKKWVSKDAKRKTNRALPRYLLAYAENKLGHRVLCAVPTDIESLTDNFRASPYARPQASAQIRVKSPGVNTQLGAVTCALNVPGSTVVHALSCHHVFAMSTATSLPGTEAEGEVEVRATNEPVGSLSAWRGRIVSSDQGTSFDAAIARIDNVTGLQQALGGIQADSFIDSTDDLRSVGVIVRPGDAAGGKSLLKVKLVKVWNDFALIDYSPSIRPPPVQPTVVEWEVEDGVTVGGDSGSPVLTKDLKVLMGMHIAGAEGTRAAFMLPANLLFFGPNYGKPGRLRLVQV